MKSFLIFLCLLITLTASAQRLSSAGGLAAFVPAPAAGGGPAPSIVNAAQGFSFTGSSATANISPTAGHLLVAVASGHGGGGWSTTDTQSSGWTYVTNEISSTPTAVAMFYLKNCPAGITSVTITGSGDNQIVLTVYEIANASLTSPLTLGEYSSLHENGLISNPSLTVNYATANSILIGVWGSYGNNFPSSIGSWSYYSSACYNSNASGSTLMSSPSKVETSAGSDTITWTVVADDQFSIIAAAFH